MKNNVCDTIFWGGRKSVIRIETEKICCNRNWQENIARGTTYPGYWIFFMTEFAFFLAADITQVIDSIAWVRCASGNVSFHCSNLSIVQTFLFGPMDHWLRSAKICWCWAKTPSKFTHSTIQLRPCDDDVQSPLFPLSWSCQGEAIGALGLDVHSDFEAQVLTSILCH